MMPVRLEEIPVSKILPNPYQVRKTFDKEKIAELAESIKATGQVVPVMATETRGGFLLVAGERRLRAARKAGEKTILAAVMEVPKEKLRLRALIENLAREGLEDVEKEEAIAKEWESGRWRTREELSRALGQSQSFVADILHARDARKVVLKDKNLAQREFSTRALRDVAYLLKTDKDAALTVLKSVKEDSKEGGIAASEVREAVHIVRDLAPASRKALAKGEIDLKRAKDLARIRNEKQQDALLGEVVEIHERAKRHETAVTEHRTLQHEGKRGPTRTVRDVETETLDHLNDVVWKVRTLNTDEAEELSGSGRKAYIRGLIDIRVQIEKILNDLGALKIIEAQ